MRVRARPIPAVPSPDQATRERILLAAVKVQGAITKTYYGNANKYMLIFEANKPILNHPDKIYPGQMLRIPVEG